MSSMAPLRTAATRSALRQLTAAPPPPSASFLVSSTLCSSSSISGNSTHMLGGARRSGAAFTAATSCSVRTFYEKIREHRDTSDDGPEQMFMDFAKSPNRQRAPAELHKGNKTAVEDAEFLNRAFLYFLLVFFPVGIYFLNPFRTDPYERPEGYGLTAMAGDSGHGKRL